MNHAVVEVVRSPEPDGTTNECLVIRDIGDHTQCLTVTNDVEWVIDHLPESLCGRRLEYYDSNGDRDEILVVNGKFAGFKTLGWSRGRGR